MIGAIGPPATPPLTPRFLALAVTLSPVVSDYIIGNLSLYPRMSMPDTDPADQPDKSGLTPNQRALINQGIMLGASAIAIPLTMAGLPATGPLMAGLGTLLFQSFSPGKTPEAAYYEALSQQIAQMEAVLLDSLNYISDEIKSLQTELTEIAAKLALEIDLTVYNQSKAVINQYYDDFADAVRDVSNKGGPNSNPQGDASELFQLFRDHADDVAIQMQLLHDTLLNGADGTEGLIAQQQRFVISTVQSWVANPQNYSLGRKNIGRNGTIDAYRCRDIFTTAYGTAAGHALNGFVQPFIASVMTLQYRGLTFLTTAWAKTDRMDQLQRHIDNAKDVMTATKALIDFITNPATIDATIKAQVAKTGFQRASSDLALNDHGESFVSVGNWAKWDGATFVNVGNNDVNFGRSYTTWWLLPRRSGPPAYGWWKANQSQTVIPAPSSQVPHPLTPGVATVSNAVTQALAQVNGPKIVLTSIPPAGGGTIAGQVSGLANAAGAKVNVFEYVGDAWSLQASNAPLAADGSFSAKVAGNAAAYWAVLVVTPAWVWTGAGAHAAPDINANVLAYQTVPPAAASDPK